MSGQEPLQKLSEEVIRLKKERNAIILAHVYQRPEVQEVADYVGDSLGLSQQAASTGADVIVFCGVHFMAESASILCPDKIVLLPEKSAGCPMADMAAVQELKRKKQELPGSIVVCYVNTSAEVKAESDIACTSANAVEIVASLPEDKTVLFVPDKNLGSYIASRNGREMIMWQGYCPAHDSLNRADILKAKAEHPDAMVLVHPECRPEVVKLADLVTSTSGMIRFVKESNASEFIIGTEGGILYPLQQQCPGKRFYLASDALFCHDMKVTTLEKVHRALVSLEPQVKVPEEIRERAFHCLERMLDI
jgi:quinolinate synthase